MVEKQAGRVKRLELRADLHRELTAHPRQSKKPNAGAAHIRIETAVPARQAGYFGARKRRKPIDEHQMQTNPQVRQATGTRDGVSRGKVASLVAEMIKSPEMMRRRLREGVEFFQFLRSREMAG